MRRQIAPRLNKYFEGQEEIPIENDEFFKQAKPNLADSLALEAVTADPNQDPTMMQNHYQQAVKNKKDFYLKNENQDTEDLDVEFYVTNEGFDKQTLVQNLKDVLFNFSQIAGNPDAQPTLRELYDILGLDSKALIPEAQQQMPQQQMPQAQQAPGAQTQGDMVMAATNRVNQGSFA